MTTADSQTATEAYDDQVDRMLANLDRLQAIASIVEKVRGEDYTVTIDGNEQYEDLDALHAFYEAMGETRSLETLWRNTLVVEQPPSGSPGSGFLEARQREQFFHGET